MYKHSFHPSILREYDIRGIINETLFEKDAFMIGYFFGLICKEKNLNNETNIVISMDGRLSSPDLKKQTTSGLTKSGCNVIDIGLNPTPILYFGSHHLNADGAIQITGSHNPKNYNGFKMMIKNEPFFGKDIQKLGIKAKSGSNINMNGSIESLDLDEKYLKKILMPLANAKNLKDKKIIWDCGNGATGDIINKIVKLLPCQNTVLYSEIDGNFPNHHPDPSNENI
jgi:phosphomannomutase